MTRILIIDKDEAVRQSLRNALENNSYEVNLAENGKAGLKVAWQQAPDLVIVDLMLPVMDGLETCRRLRELGVPSIFVTGPRKDDRSVVKALEMGADDYLNKPVAVPILLAKIHNLMRRNKAHATNSLSVYDDGQLLIDLGSRRIELRGQEVKLTPTEFRLLTILLKKMGRVVTHQELIKEVWGTDKEDGLGLLKLYIHYLRQKIEDRPKKPQYLLAEWGIGYRFRELV